MCLYTRYIKNPKYKPNKKNNGHTPKPVDERTLLVPIGCGNCIECREQLARTWKIRLYEEMKDNPECYFVTLTFNEDSLQWFKESCDTENKAATAATRMFLERWRKKNKKSCRHWLITELGHEGTERIHLHGILFCNNEQIQDLEKIWKYGWVHIGEYCNERTINYIIKYITKIDNNHTDFRGKILCSPGIGSGYITQGRARNNTYRKEKTHEYYITNNGSKIAMPMYYRQKLWSDNERENLWLYKIEKKTKYIMQTPYDISNQQGIRQYAKALTKAQEINERIGYKKPENWTGNDKLINDLGNLNVKKR